MTRFYWEVQAAGEMAAGTISIERGDYKDAEKLEQAFRQKLLDWGYAESDIDEISVSDDEAEVDFVMQDTDTPEATAEEILSFNGWMDQREE